MCYYITLCAIILHNVLLYYIMCYYITQCAIILHNVLLYYTMCYYTTQCVIILHNVLLYYTMCWGIQLISGRACDLLKLLNVFFEGGGEL